MSCTTGGHTSPKATQTSECPICLEPMPPKTAATTRCGHKFHQDCLEHVQEDCHALGKPTPCPMCRQPATLEPLCLICRSPLWDELREVTELGTCNHMFHKLCIHSTELDQYRRNHEVPHCGRTYCFHCRQPVFGPTHWHEEVNIETPNGWCVAASLSRDFDVAHIFITGPDGRRGFAHMIFQSSEAFHGRAGDHSFQAQMSALLDTISRQPLFQVKSYTRQSLSERHITRPIRTFLLPGVSSDRINEFLRENLGKDHFDKAKKGDALADLLEVFADPEVRKTMPQHNKSLLEEGILPLMLTGSFITPIDDVKQFKKTAREVFEGLKNVDPFELGWYPENG